MDLALNNLQRLICHKTNQTNQPSLNAEIELFDHLAECKQMTDI